MVGVLEVELGTMPAESRTSAMDKISRYRARAQTLEKVVPASAYVHHLHNQKCFKQQRAETLLILIVYPNVQYSPSN